MSQIVNSGARLTEMRQRDIQPQEMERAHPLERRFPLHPSLTSFIYTADDSHCRRPTRRDKSALSSSQHPPSRHQRPAKSVSFPALFGCHCSDSACSASARSYACFLGGHESSPATAAYTAPRHRGKRPLPDQAARWNYEIPSPRLGPSVPKRLRSPRSLFDAHS